MWLIEAVSIAFQIAKILIILRVFLSWFRPSLGNPAVRFIYEFSELFLGPIRRLVPPVGMWDFSPLLALLVLYGLERLTLTLLQELLVW